jgi:two-component system response regulator CpxR
MSAIRKLLIVDDDAELCDMLRDYLSQERFSVDLVHDGIAGIDRVQTHSYDLVILDMMLPKAGGIEVLKQIRARERTPIIFLTAKGDSADRIVGLELGADDYVPKPFEPRELLARIYAVLRRGQPSESNEVRSGNIRLTPGNRGAWVGTKTMSLTSVEYDLLLAFCRKPGHVISREILAKQIGRQLLPFDRTIDMHVVNLRRKLSEADASSPQILTIRGSGYLIEHGEGGP